MPDFIQTTFTDADWYSVTIYVVTIDIYRQTCIIIHEIVKKNWVFFNDLQRPRVFGLVTNYNFFMFLFNWTHNAPRQVHKIWWGEGPRGPDPALLVKIFHINADCPSFQENVPFYSVFCLWTPALKKMYLRACKDRFQKCITLWGYD